MTTTTITSARPCGHSAHHGTCPCCQRAAAAHQRAQLAEAIALAPMRDPLARRIGS